MSIVVVGKNSFLARALAAHPDGREWTFLTHHEALESGTWTKDAGLVINCAFAPSFHTKGYHADEDIDTKLAERIAGGSAHYIMLSSRLVYGTKRAGLPFRETDEAAPDTPYGEAKWRIEQSLVAALGQARLTILRPSNIFGDEYRRKSFFGMALTSLKDQNKIFIDLAPESLRDFLPVKFFADYVTRFSRARLPGLYNLGAGFGTKAEEIASWLIEGYGSGEIVYTGRRTDGQFWLDMGKTAQAFSLNKITPDILREECMACGRRLREL